MLEFCVKDNGIGMRQETIDRILSQKDEGSVGLPNINRRLKKLYGKGLVIISKPGEGTEVRWTVPVAAPMPAPADQEGGITE